jgi:hypothetical protein
VHQADRLSGLLSEWKGGLARLAPRFVEGGSRESITLNGAVEGIGIGMVPIQAVGLLRRSRRLNSSRPSSFDIAA